MEIMSLFTNNNTTFYAMTLFLGNRSLHDDREIELLRYMLVQKKSLLPPFSLIYLQNCMKYIKYLYVCKKLLIFFSG